MFKFSPNIAVQVKDFNNAISFYKNVLGFDFKEIRPFDGGEEAVMEKDGVTFYLEKVIENPPGTVFFEFETEDIIAAEQKLRDAGCNIYLELTPYSKMVKDPYGILFHLYEKGKA